MAEADKINWQQYEAITKYIYESLGKQSGVTVLGWGRDFKVAGKSGVKHQIDVLTSHTAGANTYTTAIECKCINSKINKEVVMKLSEIVGDCGYSKGIIVAKSHFTKDAMDYAKHRNIDLVHLKEAGQDEENKTGDIEFGILEIKANIIIKRPEIINITVEPLNPKEQFPVSNTNQIIAKHRVPMFGQLPFSAFIRNFQDYLHNQNRVFEIITKQYKLPGVTLINTVTGAFVEIRGINFTGVLMKIDNSENKQFTLVDKVWLLMKSIFDQKNFTISKSGIIIGDKNNG